ncbi:MAG: class I SAM-dependent methyltransferase [Actinobacteria bacterium]|nr:class I SAM-dependent methyltransferase [Actinomycetota bacterium]
MEPDQRSELVQHIYRERFEAEDLAFKRAMWTVLCRDYFQRYVRPEDTVVDLGAGTCEFINAIEARRKIAVDLNPDLKQFALDAEVLQVPATNLSPIASGSIDVVFTSNFFEHLADKDEVLRVLRECHRVLRPGGQLIILMPNIRYLPGRYWDYFDHHTPLTHLSLKEALSLTGYGVQQVIPRFLPYTVKGSRALQRPWLVRVYLRVRLLWPIFGRQMLVVGRREVTA